MPGESTSVTFLALGKAHLSNCKEMSYLVTRNERRGLRQIRDGNRAGQRSDLRPYRSCIQMVSRRLGKNPQEMHSVSS